MLMLQRSWPLFLVGFFLPTISQQGTIESDFAPDRKPAQHEEASQLARHSQTFVRRQRSVSNEKCLGNKIAFGTSRRLSCFYDDACFQKFFDCCPDFEKVCGRQVRKPKFISQWTCSPLGEQRSHCWVKGVVGVWMIQSCPATWLANNVRRKCENASETLSYPVEDFIPVIGRNQFTYRNKHCAVCNGEKNYTTWNVRAYVSVMPPENLDLDSKLKFIQERGGTVQSVEPPEGQPRRYCIGENYVGGCSNITHPAYNNCINGPVEVVIAGKMYKNSACAACHELPGLTGDLFDLHCLNSSAFSMVFNIKEPREKATTTVVSNRCPPENVYDPSLQICRKGYIVTSRSKLFNEFLVVMWFRKYSIKTIIDTKLRDYFQSAVTAKFSLQANQISRVEFHKLDASNQHTTSTFRLTLTPYQSLVLANQTKSERDIKTNRAAFLELLNFRRNFTLIWKNVTFAVVKVVSKQLSCYQGKTYEKEEYTLKEKEGILVINGTKEILHLKNYTVLEDYDGNITLCRKLLLSDCREGAYVPLHPYEYHIFPNLTLYHTVTNRRFNFGEYQIYQDVMKKDNTNVSGQMKHLNMIWNLTVAICLPFQDTFSKNETEVHNSSSALAKEILTLIGFSVSIILLSLLLVTYGIFRELRTLPGLNLMSLSLSLLLSHLLWLVGTARFQGTIMCAVFAISMHYLFLVSFMAMSVISYHSCHVFSHLFATRNSERIYKKFLKYSILVWCTPAIFVAVCVILDKTETFPVDYGEKCWLGTDKAKLYLFLLPVAVLMLYNICTFVKTAVTLSRHEQDGMALRKDRRQNLLVCVKLATLVGFPWVFAFFGVLFPNAAAVEYLFIIFVTLQGFYIGMAFLCNKKTLKLFQRLYQKGKRKAKSEPQTPTFEMM